MGRPVHLIQKGSDGREAGPVEGWIEQLAPSGLVTTYQESGPSTINWPDQFPILLLSKGSLAALDAMVRDDPLIREARGFDVERWTGEVDKGVEVQRFRGNIIVEGLFLTSMSVSLRSLKNSPTSIICRCSSLVGRIMGRA